MCGEIVVTGLPASLSTTPTDMIKEVFRALDASDLACLILKVRAFSRSKSATPRSSSGVSTSSYFVLLSSASVCKAIINKKRAKRILKQRDVYPSGSDQSIYINEVLSKETYSLIQSVKQMAKERSYKYV